MVLLDVAIKNLDFIVDVAKRKTPTLLDIDIEGNHLIKAKKRHSLLYPLFHRNEYQVKRRGIRQILFSSIETLKKHYRLIQKMKRGSEEEQHWARHALDSINQYNALLIKSRKPPKTVGETIVRFLYTQTGLLLIDAKLKKILIEIPSEIFVRFDTLGESEEKTMEQIATNLKKGKLVEYSKNERDLFCMRAITLTKTSDLTEKFSDDISELLRQTPIIARETEGDTSSSVISMSQMLTPFPGEVITVEGQFKRSQTSRVPSVPDPKSFRVSTVVTQTGFPHPSQYAGWALSNALIPANPLRMDLLTHFRAVLKIKKQVAADLLPGQRLNQKAKELLHLKKLAFNRSADPMITLHEKLSDAIYQAAPYEELKREDDKAVTHQFFDQVRAHPSPFDYVSQTHHLINKYFIEYPHEKLFQEWHDLENPALHEGEPKERYRASFALIEEALSLSAEEIKGQLKQPQTEIEATTLHYVLKQGRLLGRAALSLYLQYFSEKVGYPPPLLKHFELMVQTSSIHQVLAFQKELDLPLPLQIEEKRDRLLECMTQYLSEEIALFCDDGHEEEPSSKISHELERYFNARYNAKRHFFKKPSDPSR